ncbi:Rrf2 family transcriptional regulator [Conexibacter sp. DBS9H8]|uniref:RrF2 family transcriptional regulator n=1 Tax=Conexibacter sp. DBS9H8 TaxID=2937801 RepID=UPI00200FC2C8|nr:Rrf2 family transcriptional regulator [Conexibacter sp. DBS9H8]
MIFSSKAEYGVRLMVELGRQTPEQPTSLKAIADAEGLPLAYLEQVVARLKKAGLVMSARGAHGGYWLAREPAEITMFDVVGALEGTIAPMECFVRDEMERVVCSHLGAQSARGCATKLLWTRVQSGIVRSLQTTTLAELVEFSRRSETDPEPAGRLVSVTASAPAPAGAPERATTGSAAADPDAPGREMSGPFPVGLRAAPAPEPDGAPAAAQSGRRGAVAPPRTGSGRRLGTVTPLRVLNSRPAPAEDPTSPDGTDHDHDPAPAAA